MKLTIIELLQNQVEFETLEKCIEYLVGKQRSIHSNRPLFLCFYSRWMDEKL